VRDEETNAKGRHMVHPHTSQRAGFREFNGTTFGELQSTDWKFDGTEEDVRAFAAQNLGGDVTEITRVSDLAWDVTVGADGHEYRVSTAAVVDCSACPEDCRQGEICRLSTLHED
jgi:hypothetical protein